MGTEGRTDLVDPFLAFIDKHLARDKSSRLVEHRPTRTGMDYNADTWGDQEEWYQDQGYYNLEDLEDSDAYDED